MPKATVQAAFCGYPAYLIDKACARTIITSTPQPFDPFILVLKRTQVSQVGGWKDDAEQERYEQWGKNKCTHVYS